MKKPNKTTPYRLDNVTETINQLQTNKQKQEKAIKSTTTTHEEHTHHQIVYIKNKQ
eukprot:m.243211 g.243211  ORF g.243211 m.243211 type:complete len:56 (+) comp41298_c0_seq1:105-272(+)